MEIPDPEKILLGKTQITISPLGIGVWEWGDKFYWGYGLEYDETDVHDAFSACIEAGVNFFDTAEVYGQGRSERLLGQFIRSHTAETNQPIVVATKFFPYPWRLWKGSLNIALDNSLKRLQMDCVDLYQIHWPYPPISIETWSSALADVISAGKATAVGVSNYSANQMRRSHAILIKRGLFLASNQVRYNLLDREIEKNGLLRACQELGITCIAYSPLAQGLLTGKYSPINPPKGFRSYRSSSRYLGKIEPVIRLLREIGRNHESKTPSQVALNWVICKGAVPIPGVKNLRQAQDNVGALGWRLTEEEISALDEATDKLST
jgi:aryl-alcohol dehydrogenase-like predicted oxidoreductase